MKTAMKYGMGSALINTMKSDLSITLKKNTSRAILAFALGGVLITTIFCKSGYSYSKESAQLERDNILLAFDFKGSLAVTARLIVQGFQIAMSTAPSTLRQYNLVQVDTGSDAKTVAEKVYQAIDRYRPRVIVGAITSNHAIAIAEVAEQRKIPFITPYATNPNVTEGRTYTFRACFDDNSQAGILAKFVARDLKLGQGVMIINETQSYARGVKEIFSRIFSQVGGRELKSIGISSEKDVNTDLISIIKKSNPQFILIPSYQIESAAIISKLSKDLPPSTIYIGTDSWGGGRLFEKLVKNLDHTFRGYYVQHWSEESKSDGNKKFIRRLKKSEIPADLRFEGTAMNSPVAIGYDTGLILIDSIKKAPSGEGFEKSIGRAQVEGATGKIDLRGRHTPEKDVFLYEISGQGERFFKQVR